MNIEAKEGLLHGPEVFRIQGAIFEVSRTMGPGFLEAIYQECLAIEFESCGIPFCAMPKLGVSYKGRPLQHAYSPDFICFDTVIVELKAARELVAEHRAQLLNYLRATGLRVGLLVNFGSSARAVVQRLVV
jgi:GxxExxY protein